MTRIARFIPEPAKAVLRPVVRKLTRKHSSELSYWKSRHRIDHGVFHNEHYERLMLAMAGEADDSFLKGKIVADFGCGPRGSLVWAKSAALRIGIDALTDRYADEFTDNIISHGMVYVKSTEKVIPLPADFVDVMFTVNAIDHVDSLTRMCGEIIRVLKPGGDFIGSFNLDGRPTSCEPQSLDEEVIKKLLLDFLDVRSYRITNQGPEDNQYLPFSQGELHYDRGNKGILWVRARKPAKNQS